MANAFVDAFVACRSQLGLRARGSDLGAVGDVGHISRNTELLQTSDPSTWTPINEPLHLRTVELSVTRQVDPSHRFGPAVKHDQQLITALAVLITGIPVPLGRDSSLLSDGRFSGLHSKADDDSAATYRLGERPRALHPSAARVAAAAAAAAALAVVSTQLQRILRFTEPMEPARPLASYGLESTGAVELRICIRKELAPADLTTLGVTNTRSLIVLCEKIVC